MGRAPRENRLRALAPLASAVVALVAATSGCGGGPSAPTALVDGSPARVLALELEGVSAPVLLTEARRKRVSSTGRSSRAASCLHDGWSERPTGSLVHRISVDGESVTFLGRSRHNLHSCDGTGRADTEGRPWCGHAFGRLAAGRLRDPRLDLGGCRTGDGRPVAFAWIEPGPGTRLVIVRRHGFSEAYETAARLPIRVSVTEGVDTERLTASLAVSEHSAGGLRLRAYDLEASVSG